MPAIFLVMPAKAGIQLLLKMDPSLRYHDKFILTSTSLSSTKSLAHLYES